jgi:MFS family permease
MNSYILSTNILLDDGSVSPQHTTAQVDTRRRTASLIAIVCLAEIVGMAAYASFPAQLLILAKNWTLSATECGWISGAFYGGYAVAVPVLVPLTDRKGALRVYLPCMFLTAVGAFAFSLFAQGFWSAILAQVLLGVGLAGTYMPGLRLLTDRLDGRSRSRAVAFYTSSYAVGTGLSFALVGTLSSAIGWRWAIGLAAVGPVLALILIAALFSRPGTGQVKESASIAQVSAWSVIRDRMILSRSIAYFAHCFELFGLWSWAVAFLAFAYSLSPDASGQVSPAIVTAVLTAILLPASVSGNEISLRIGRIRWIVSVMSISAIFAMTIGAVADGSGAGALIALMVAYGWLASAGSGALTSSLVEEARPEQRGAAMALYSTLGFAGAFAGPLIFGLVLDRFGMHTLFGWGAAFAVLGLAALLGPLALLTIGRNAGRHALPRPDIMEKEEG